MTLQLGGTAPDFEADTTEGRSRFHERIGDTQHQDGPDEEPILRVTR
jgi:hypothetical protein